MLTLLFQLYLPAGLRAEEPPPPPPIEALELNQQPVGLEPELQVETWVTPEPQAIISPTLSLSQAEIEPGRVVTLTITLSNIGTAPAGVTNLALLPGTTLTPTLSLPRDETSGAYLLVSEPLAVNDSQSWLIPLWLGYEVSQNQVIALYSDPVEDTVPPAQAAITLNVTGLGNRSTQSEEPGGWLPRFVEPDVSAFSGAATYGYALDVAPGRNGIQPNLALSYNSRSTDGVKAYLDSGEVGEGWSLGGIPAIIRNNVTYCWGGNYEWICLENSFTLILNGASHKLLPMNSDQNFGVYQAEDDPALYVERRNDAAGNSSLVNLTGEYWLVRTADGTEYRFGYNEDAEQTINHTEGTNDPTSNDPPYTGRVNQTSTYRWFVDRVNDRYGNGMAFTYHDDVNDLGHLVALDPYGGREVATYPEAIYYNNATPFSYNSWQSSVVFTYHDMERQIIGNQAPIFGNQLRLDALAMYQGGQLLWDYQLEYHTFVFAPNGTSIFSLTAIQQRDFNGQATLPATTFGYIELTNGWDCVINTPSGDCLLKVYYNYPRLETIHNGYGGVYRFTYENIEHNGVKSYYVTKLERWDGFQNSFAENDLPTTIIDYQRLSANACFDDLGPGNQACGDSWPSSQKLVGFSSTTTTTRPGNSPTYLAFTVSQFHIGNASLTGKPTWQGQYYPLNGQDLLAEKSWSWSGDDGTCPQTGLVFDYICLWQERNKVYYYPAGQPVTSLENWNTYSYDPQYQGNRQWGLSTQQETWYKNKNGQDTRYAIQLSRYRTNTSTWLAVPWATALYDGSWVAQSMAVNLYDGQMDPDNQTITNGRLTLTRQFWLKDLDAGSGLLYKTLDTTFGYDSYGNQTSVTAYADYGQVGKSGSNWDSWTVPGNGSVARPVTAQFKNYGLQLDWQRDPAGNQTSYLTYHSRFSWLPTSIVDPNNLTASYAFDNSARLTAVARPGDSLANPTLQYLYTLPTSTTPFRVSTIIQPSQTSPALHRHTVAHYNGFGQLVQSNTLDLSLYQVTGLRDQTVLYGYDALGRKTCESVPFEITGPGGPYQTTPCASLPNTTTAYDYRGGVRYAIEPTGATTSRSYLIPGSWVDTVGSGYQQEYIQDANGNITVYTQDMFGQLDWVGQYDNNNCLQVTDYSHTVTGNLTQVRRGGTVCGATYTVGGVVTTMTYDELGRKTAMSDPDMGNWAYDYDPSGNLLSQTANNALKICFTYDNLNRLLSKFKNGTATAPCDPALSGSQALATYTYRTSAPAIGQPDTISWGAEPDYNQDRFTYDSLGRLSEQSRWLDGRVYRFKTITFDLLHRPLTVEYPTGESVTMSYDREGPESLTAGADPLVSTAGYNVLGQLRFLDRPTALPDTTFNYFSSGSNKYRLSNISTGWFFNANYTYDALGNVLSITDVVPVDDEKQLFSYDRLNRLVTACATTNPNHTDCTSPTGYKQSYSYDTLGNLTQITTNNLATSYNYNATQPHAVDSLSGGQTATFGYDAHGNMTTRTDSTGSYTQAYDPENRLLTVDKSGVGLTSFGYDANGQRTTTLTPDGNLSHSPFPIYETSYHTPTRDNLSQDPATRWTENVGNWSWEEATQYYDSNTSNQQNLVTLNAPTFNSNGTLAANIRILPTNAAQQNGFLVYDYQNNSNYKFAGIDALNNLVVIGYRSGSNVVSTSSPLTVDTDKWYDVKVVLSGNQAKLYVNGVYRHQYTYSAAFSGGKVGFRTSKGQAHFDNLLFTNSQTERSLYALGNQTIATRVSGDPVSGNNGLFYIFSDHLGSTSVLATSTGNQVPGSRATYYPFGSPRTAPTQTITDRNFTGQKENLELGLIYFNARYYLPNLARFLTPDTLVPDPQNPQAYNRYTYVLNNPLRFTDPSGHCATGDEACWYYLDNLFCYEIDCGDVGWRKWIIVDAASTWSFAELWKIHEALYNVKNALASIGINWLDTHLNGVQFERIHGSDVNGKGNPADYNAIPHRIRLSDSVATKSRTILHELGHAIDGYSPLMDLHDSYAIFSGSCGNIFCGDTAEGYYYRNYGKSDQEEAWADAFAVWVFTKTTGKGSPPDKYTDGGWDVINDELFPDFNAINLAVEISLHNKYGPLPIVTYAYPIAGPTPFIPRMPIFTGTPSSPY